MGLVDGGTCVRSGAGRGGRVKGEPRGTGGRRWNRAGHRLSGRPLTRRVVVAMIKRRAVPAVNRVVTRSGSSEQQLRGHVIRAKAFLAGGDRSACEHAVEAVLALIPELDFISREGIMALMGFSVDLGPQRMRQLIRTSPSAHLLLPLTTALERELGHEPRVAREVDEVAQDIQQTLATLKAN